MSAARLAVLFPLRCEASWNAAGDVTHSFALNSGVVVLLSVAMPGPLGSEVIVPAGGTN